MPFDITPITTTHLPGNWARTNLTLAEHMALVRVRNDLASGAIPPEYFDMHHFTSWPAGHCGTAHCIGGWMTYYMRISYQRASELHSDPRFSSLFYGFASVGPVDPARAVTAIDNFLSTGVGWELAVPPAGRSHLTYLDFLLF
jgi:hypothetical protein